jgi:hypothetical protein
MVESDDVGASPTNQHGTGDCYLASTSAFALSTFNGGLVFSQNGESGSGVPEGSLILLSASSGTVNSGYADQLKAGSADSNLTFTGGSFSTPDSTYGRSTLTLNASGGSGPSPCISSMPIVGSCWKSAIRKHSPAICASSSKARTPMQT